MATPPTAPARSAVGYRPLADSRSPKPMPNSTMKVLVGDSFEQSGLDGLRNLGCDVVFKPDLSSEALAAAVVASEANILVVRGKKVGAHVFEKASKLSLILRAGAGYDSIDVAAASARGIFVANCPGKNAIAVAELTWALILSCDRRVPDQTADLRAGRWNKVEYSKASGLFGRTLGIVGLGQIGLEVAARGKAFGMNIVAWSRSLSEEKADALDIGYCSSIINLAKMSDVVSVHVAGTPDTRHLINEQFFAAMKNGASFINTSRGAVVDSAALTNAIRAKSIRCGLDVFATEPSSPQDAFTDPIVKEPGVYGSHHVGASTEQAQQAIAREAVRVVAEYVRTGRVQNCVNRAAKTPATCLLTVRHLNRPGVLAHIFYTLGQAGINVEEMENIIYEGTQAACARIQLDQAPHPEHMTAISANEHVLSAELTSLAMA